MKGIFQCYTDIEVTDRVKARAKEVGAPIGDLFALLLTLSLEKVSTERLQEWALKLPNRKGPLAGGLTKADRAVVSALTALRQGEVKKGTPVFRFATEDIAHSAGLRVAVAQDTLNALLRREMVGMLVFRAEGQDEVDRWGRQNGCHWWLPVELEAFEAARAAKLAAGG